MNYGVGQIQKMNQKDKKNNFLNLRRRRLYHSLMEMNIRKI
jgi:hypothetical protein